MKIGILKESDNEKRVALLPEHVKILSGLKVETVIEKGAGEGAFVSDNQYAEVGAAATDRAKVVKESDIIVSVNGPADDEIEKSDNGKVLIAAFNPLSGKSHVEVLKKSGATSFSLDIIPRTTKAQAMDVLSSMATVAGYKAVLDAALQLPRFFPMFMSAAGTIKPAKVLILGAGVAGLQAIASAKKLGAVVEVFDVRSAVKEEVQSLGGKFIEVEGAKEDSAAGGYAVEQAEDFKQKQAQAIHDHAVKSDVIICTAQIPGKKAPLLVKKETVEAMRAGSVIIDLAASTGGNCEVTSNGKTTNYKEITVIGESSYPNRMSSDASKMFGTNLINFLKLLIDEEGNLKIDMEDEIIAGTCVAHKGEIISQRVKTILNQ